MDVSVIIPTYNRPKLLRQTVQSIKANTHKKVTVIVVVDGNPNIINLVSSLDVTMIVNEKRIDWIKSMNRNMRTALDFGDAVIYASDDLYFDSHCIKNAVNRLTTKSPDLDALVTITQNVKGCMSAFGLMGRRFIEHFPKCYTFCPDYIHYVSDSEIGKYARSRGRLYECPSALVTHVRAKDETYHLAKPIESRDYRARDMRRENEWLWGRDFNLLVPCKELEE